MTPAAAIALSGVNAATLRLNVSASNVANADDVSAPGAAGYQAQGTDQSSTSDGGVSARAVTLKPGQALVFDPTSILAGPSGLVSMPEVNPIEEVTNQMQSAVAFSAALKAFGVAQKEEKTLLNLKT